MKAAAGVVWELWDGTGGEGRGGHAINTSLRVCGGVAVSEASVGFTASERLQRCPHLRRS